MTIARPAYLMADIAAAHGERREAFSMSHPLRLRVLRGSLHSAIAALIVVYALGMTVNLYLAFPSNLSPMLAMSMPMVQVHVIGATLALLAGLVALVMGVVERRIWAASVTCLGVALTLLAYSGGMMFVNGGYQNSASLTMAFGFIGALLAFTIAAFLTSSAVEKR
jgi:hypothetical protein